VLGHVIDVFCVIATAMAEDGRNLIRFSNSGARTLIENWVEEVKSVQNKDY
jgi:hypothetical protein